MAMPNTTNTLTYAEFCAGIGGFRLGIESAFHNAVCVYKNEIDPKCEITYQKNYGEQFDSHDIFDIECSLLPDFDMLCAGFPCQPFSIAGGRKGFEDARGQIIFKLLEIIAHKSPPIIFLENVPNLETHDRGRTLQTILSSLLGKGYKVFHSVLDSSLFNLAQSRPRLYIIAFKMEIFGETDFAFPEGHKKLKTVRDILVQNEKSIPISDRWNEYIDFYTNRKGIAELSFSPPKTRLALERVSTNCDLADCILQIRSSGIRAYSLDGQFPTFAVSNSGGGAMIPVLTKERRHIGVCEIKRLMGFPDSFEFPVSRTDSIKQLANAVCPPVICAITEKILTISIA